MQFAAYAYALRKARGFYAALLYVSRYISCRCLPLGGGICGKNDLFDVPRQTLEQLRQTDIVSAHAFKRVEHSPQHVVNALVFPKALHGKHVLLKPNLVTARPLACTSPAVVAAACRWLLDQGARVRVADSPGFGTATAVARKTGLTEALAPLDIRVEALDAPQRLPLDTGVDFPVSRLALESDLILSAARVKAHSQMRLTLSVKNLFGCVCGLRKAIIHTRQGQEPDFFADCLAALQAALPPSAGLLDGITAMHVTGPSNGSPYPLGLLGASSSCVALDEAFCTVLGCATEDVPLAAALLRRGHTDCLAGGCRPRYPFLHPADCAVEDFRVPAHLLHTSFRPWRLLKSCLRRFWLSFKT